MLLSVNFLVFWAVPIFGMGQAYHLGLKHVLRPLYDRLDRSAALRRFAAAYVYNKPAHADFAATAVLTFLSTTVAFGVALRYQLVHGHLPWALHAAYNCAWVGIGGRMMGSAYTFAHKEGHNGVLYQRWVRRTVGNLFENWVGLLYGNVPYNFTTSHNHIHHALDGGKARRPYPRRLRDGPETVARRSRLCGDTASCRGAPHTLPGASASAARRLLLVRPRPCAPRLGNTRCARGRCAGGARGAGDARGRRSLP